MGLEPNPEKVARLQKEEDSEIIKSQLLDARIEISDLKNRLKSKDTFKEFQIFELKQENEKLNSNKKPQNGESSSTMEISVKEKYGGLIKKHNNCKKLVEKLKHDIR